MFIWTGSVPIASMGKAEDGSLVNQKGSGVIRVCCWANPFDCGVKPLSERPIIRLTVVVFSKGVVNSSRTSKRDPLIVSICDPPIVSVAFATKAWPTEFVQPNVGPAKGFSADAEVDRAAT